MCRAVYSFEWRSFFFFVFLLTETSSCVENFNEKLNDMTDNERQINKEYVMGRGCD